MLYILIIYAVFLILFCLYTKIGFYHIRKNKSVADVTSEDFILIYKEAAIFFIACSIIALILELTLIK